MYGSFDGYQQWLGIPPSDRPAHHYRLLGLAPLENDPAVILRAIEEREAYVRAMSVQCPEAAEEILGHLASARHLLLSPTLKAQYDATLAQQAVQAGAYYGPPGMVPVLPPAAPGPVPPAMMAEYRPPVAPLRSPPVQSAPPQDVRSAEPAKGLWSHPLAIAGVAGGTVLAVLLILAVLGGGGGEETARTRAKKRPAPSDARESSNGGSAANGKSNGKSNGNRQPPEPPSPKWPKGAAPPMGPRTMGDLMAQGHDSPLDTNSATGLLAATRKALADRQIETARNHLEAAQGMARSPTEKAEAERVAGLVTAVEAFWTAVREVAEKLQGGDEIRIGDNACIVVQNDGGRLIVRADGKNRDYEIIRGLPRQLAIGIAQRRMPGDGTAANLRIGAFLAVDSRGDRQQARQRLEKAGAEGRALLPEIELAGPVKPSPGGGAGRDPAMHPFDEGKTAGDWPALGGDKRLPVPDAKALDAAEKQVRDMYKSDFAAAAERKGKEELAKKLFDKAEKTKDNPALRYCLYQSAHDLAVALGDPESFFWAAGRMEEIYQVDGLAVKAQDLAVAWREQTDRQVRDAVYQASLKLLDQAMKAKHHLAAERAVRVALAGASAARDFAQVRQLEQTAKQIREGM